MKKWYGYILVIFLVVCSVGFVIIKKKNDELIYHQALKKNRETYFESYEKVIEHQSIIKDNKTIDLGKKVVVKEGKDGRCQVQNVKVRRGDVVYVNQLNQTMLEPSVDEIVHVGSKKKPIETKKTSDQVTVKEIPFQVRKPQQSNQTQTKSKKSNSSNERSNTTTKGLVLDSSSKESFRKINQFRNDHGMKSLVWDNRIYQATTLRAQELTVKFDHVRPSGKQWDSVTYDLAAENLAYGYAQPQSLVQGWIDSSGHRQNLLNPHANKGAVAMFKDEKGVVYSAFLAGW
ncbi:CAP domain-containing protein [Erysipelothrix urinaevulpis]|uniref:CAP domain-containing protein n=1 Tax=Erysipelothrix urinaevulpis TaxID=2683717 RepID=UPI00135C354C|nr:CAP domain-containing protein [Erysipelothrix urinaevulpis]